MWQLKFQLSGGFAGFDREMTFSSTGELTAIDRRRSVRVESRVSPKELAQVASFLEDLKREHAVRERNCRDCLEYDIELQMGGRSFVSHFNDVSLAGKKTEGLVKALMNLLDRALAQR